MSCFLSMLTTTFCSLTSRTVLVLGTSSSMPDCKIGAVIIKMIRRTRTMSMNGTMLISDSDDCVWLEICGIGFYSAAARWRAARRSVERFFDLRGDFQRESVQALRKNADVLQKLIVKDNRGDGDEKAGGGGQQRFGNARRNRAQAGGTGAAEA